MDFDDGDMETPPERGSDVDVRALLGWLTEQIDRALERDNVPATVH